MATVYMYADETGDLGYDSKAPYFGIGTATFVGDHRDAIWRGFELRVACERRGMRMQKGLHAKDDSNRTRHEMFTVIRDQPVRIDSTFLLKENAYPNVKEAGPVRLYQLAFYLHFKEIMRQVSQPGDDVVVVAGHLQTNAKRDAIRDAVDDVCRQLAADRSVTPCVWDAPSSWGIQVADYCLWSIQRDVLGRPNHWHETCVKPKVRSVFTPWGRA